MNHLWQDSNVLVRMYVGWMSVDYPGTYILCTFGFHFMKQIQSQKHLTIFSPKRRKNVYLIRLGNYFFQEVMKN
jgi:hypothetical protein